MNRNIPSVTVAEQHAKKTPSQIFIPTLVLILAQLVVLAVTFFKW